MANFSFEIEANVSPLGLIVSFMENGALQRFVCELSFKENDTIWVIDFSAFDFETVFFFFFSLLERYFLTCYGPTIKVTSMATGKDVRMLSDHKDDITSLISVPEDPYQVIISYSQMVFISKHYTNQNKYFQHVQILSSSYDGTIKRWNINEGVVLNSHQVNSAVLQMVLDPKNSMNVFLLIRGLCLHFSWSAFFHTH